jgi:hypothetical protein
MSTGPDCRAVRDDLAELALGTLDGFERSVVLAHVQGCPSCLEEVGRLSAAADTVLALAPHAEPPPGFETRLFERMGVRRHRWRLATRAQRAVAAAVAVAGMLGLGLGIGLATTGAPTATVQPAPIVANLTADHSVKGQVYLAPGHPGWLFMSVHGVRANGVVSCRLDMSGGRTLTVGSFYLEAGSGSWAYQLPVPADQVHAAWLVDGSGAILASARLQS